METKAPSLRDGRIAHDGGRGLFVVGYGEVEVAPVDAEVVAGAVEDVLVARADGEHGLRLGLIARVGDGLAGSVHGDDGIDVEEDRRRRDEVLPSIGFVAKLM